jgi:hypothetical protein
MIDQEDLWTLKGAPSRLVAAEGGGILLSGGYPQPYGLGLKSYLVHEARDDADCTCRGTLDLYDHLAIASKRHPDGDSEGATYLVRPAGERGASLVVSDPSRLEEAVFRAENLSRFLGLAGEGGHSVGERRGRP